MTVGNRRRAMTGGDIEYDHAKSVEFVSEE